MSSSNGGDGWLQWWSSTNTKQDATKGDDSIKDNDESSVTQTEPSKDKGVSPPDKAIRPKQSSSSLSSVAGGNWLSWSSKTNKKAEMTMHRDSDRDEGNEVKKDERKEDDNDNSNDNDEIDYDPDDNGDEVDDHICKSKRSHSSSWNFWNSNGGSSSDNNHGNQEDKEGNKDDKTKSKENEKEKKVSTANTILRSTPSIPSKLEVFSNSIAKEEKANESDDNTPPPPSDKSGDDAVLYKPHDNAKQFNKINTHKNENLKENVIVPNWNLCLPYQSSATSSTSSLVSSAFGSNSTANQGNSFSSKVDFRNWRQLLSQISTRLGFGSHSLTSVVDSGDLNQDESDSMDQVEKEVNFLYEKTYRLYGRSLAKLPSHKRACLPNYNKAYSQTHKDHAAKVQNQSSTNNPDNDSNNISISNDPMGNLLINHKQSNNPSYMTSETVTDIASQKVGPLKRIKKILIIGVHGFFPTKMIRPIIGSPKGTSLKFATEAEKAIIRYCLDNNLFNENENNVSIQKIALEKEGKIFDRVSFFTEILMKWKKELNDADFIFVAAHSQGCVVSIILLAKLIEMGILNNPIKKRIGLLGMAGINNGPFYGVDKSFFMKAYSAIEHDSLMELFELTKFSSPQSLAYKKSIQVIVNANVKICLIGSINDQLVPLYSALASHIYHPNIYRACYIDHSSQTPPFIQNLVSVCCQLQNLGYFDSNVLKELSTSLAGSFTGGGHSKIYNDGKVYDLGIRFVLDTDDIVIPATDPLKIAQSDSDVFDKMHHPASNNLATEEQSTMNAENMLTIPVTNQVYIKEFNIGKIGTNPFILPWCLRGLLFNVEKNWPNNNKLITVGTGNEVGRNGYDEISDLYELFEKWSPDTKVLKDLKFRLNGLRASKL